MILAAAQTSPKREDVKSNIADHHKLTELAAQNGAKLIVFPELSLSGYEREKAASLSFTPKDSRLDELRKLSADKNIIIIAGAPILMKSQIYIGEFIIKPNKTISIYTKQFLHGEENIYFTSSTNYNPLIGLESEQISIAVCADINHPEHVKNARKTGSTVYTASIFFEPHEMTKAHTTLSDYAKTHQMNVLMSNFSGKPYGLIAGGKSAFWNKKGELIASLNNADEGVLLIEKVEENWKGKTIYSL